jgi:hypothetical protein
MQAWIIRRLCASVPERILEEKVVLDSVRIGFSRNEKRKYCWSVECGLRGPCRTPLHGTCAKHCEKSSSKMISSSGNFANYLDELRNYEMCSLVVKPFKSVSQYLRIALETTQLSSSWLECFSLANEHTVFHICYSSTVCSFMKTISLNHICRHF